MYTRRRKDPIARMLLEKKRIQENSPRQRPVTLLRREGVGIHRQNFSGTNGIPRLPSMPEEGKPIFGDSVESAGKYLVRNNLIKII